MWVPFHWAAAAVLATTPVYADGISGAYVGSGSNSAFLVEIVETAGGQLTGRYEQTALQPDGKIEQKTASITGASDGQTIVVTIKPNTDQLFVSNITASGAIQGTMLHLTGAGGDGSKVDLNLAKSDEVAYQTEIAKLKFRAQVVNDARSRADQLAHLNDLTARMTTASVSADAQLDKFPPIEQRYRTITQLMSAALSREQSIYGSYPARGQVGVAINQAGVEAEQLHSNLQSIDQDTESKLHNFMYAASDVPTICRPEDLEKDEELRSACARFHDVGVKFKASILALSQAYAHAEKSWAEEHRKQAEIIRASDLASR